MVRHFPVRHFQVVHFQSPRDFYNILQHLLGLPLLQGTAVNIRLNNSSVVNSLPPNLTKQASFRPILPMQSVTDHLLKGLSIFYEFKHRFLHTTHHS